MKIENPKKSLNFNPQRADKLLTDLVKAFQKHKPTVGEILLVYGNLGYTLGASIGRFEDKGPSAEELQKLYYSNPTIDIALMINGLHVMTWYEDWEKIQLDKVKNKEK